MDVLKPPSETAWSLDRACGRCGAELRIYKFDIRAGRHWLIGLYFYVKCAFCKRDTRLDSKDIPTSVMNDAATIS